MRREVREQPAPDYASYLRQSSINGFYREHSQPSNTNCRAVIYLGTREEGSVPGGLVIGRDNVLDHGVLSEEVEKRLVELKEGLSLSSADLTRTDGWERMVKSAVLRDLMTGVIPHRMTVDGNLRFNFERSERVVWVFEEVD